MPRSFQSARVEGCKGIPHRTKGHWTNPAEHEGVKRPGISLSDEDKRQHIGAKRKFASAMIAKIPLALSRHIGKYFYDRAAG